MWVHKPTRACPHHHQWALGDPKLYASFVSGTGTGWGQDKEEGMIVQVGGGEEWVMQKGNETDDKWGKYLTLWKGWGRGKQVAQGVHYSVVFMVPFLRVTLQMLCGNLSNKSQLKITAKLLAVPRPSKTPPPCPAKPSLIFLFDILLNRGQKNSTTALVN